MTTPIYLHTFGKLELSQNDKVIEIPLKAQLLLVYLCRHKDKQPRERLASLLWSDSTPKRAMHSLRMALSYLRNELGDYVDISRTHVRVKHIKMDAQNFTDTLNDLHPYLNSEQPLSSKITCELTEILAIYHGHFLAGIYTTNTKLFDEWRLVEQEALFQRFMFTGRRLLEAYITQKQYADGITLASRLLANEPLHEETHHRLMMLQAIDSDDTSALQQFETYQDQLMAELGVEPGDAIITTYEQIAKRQFNTDTNPLSSNMVLTPHNLPAEINTFFGREQEIEQLMGYIQQHRCVSVVGSGGMGKTRLLLHVAKALKADFHDGVFLVKLANLVNAQLVPDAIRTALDLEHNDTPLDQINAYLQERHVLLLLDNFEHLLDAHTVVDTLLRANSHLHIIITTRKALRVYGEYVYHLPPLTDEAAVALFIDRARSMNPNFDASNTDHIQEICKRLDQLPLAVELVASLARTHSLMSISQQLSVSQLETSLRGVPERQRTLLNTIEWSYNLLSPEAQVLYPQLTFFVGTWTLEAIEGICQCENTPILLDTLVESSLVQRVPNTNRYTMLEMLRQHAQIKLEANGQLEDVRHSFIVYYMQMAENYQSARRGTTFHPNLNQGIQQNLDNIHAAIDYANDAEDYERAGRLVAALGTFWYHFGYGHEGALYAQQVLRHQSQLPDQILADVYTSLGQVMNNLNQLDDGKTYHEQALAIYERIGDHYGKAFVGFCLGFHVRESHQKNDYFQHLLPLAEVLDSPILLLSILSNIALGYIVLGKTDEAEQILQHIIQHPHIAIFDGRDHVYNLMSELLRDKGELEQALNMLTQSLAFEGGYTWMKAMKYEGFTYIYILKGDTQMAYTYWLKIEQMKNQEQIPPFLIHNYYLLKAMITDTNDLILTRHCLQKVFTGEYIPSQYLSIAVAYLIYLLHSTNNPQATEQLHGALMYAAQEDFALGAVHHHYLEKAGFVKEKFEKRIKSPSMTIFELACTYLSDDLIWGNEDNEVSPN